MGVPAAAFLASNEYVVPAGYTEVHQMAYIAWDTFLLTQALVLVWVCSEPQLLCPGVMGVTLTMAVGGA